MGAAGEDRDVDAHEGSRADGLTPAARGWKGRLEWTVCIPDVHVGQDL